MRRILYIGRGDTHRVWLFFLALLTLANSTVFCTHHDSSRHNRPVSRSQNTSSRPQNTSSRPQNTSSQPQIQVSNDTQINLSSNPDDSHVPANNDPLNITFSVAADTHFGAKTKVISGTRLNPGSRVRPMGLDEINAFLINKLNSISNTEYPKAIGGKVGTLKGLLIAGDLTENGTAAQWQQYESHYGRTGKEGLLHIPAYPVIGNHDYYQSNIVPQHIAKRFNDNYYSISWGKLQIIALRDGPDEQALQFLSQHLAKIEPKHQIVIFFHYPLLGPFSRGSWFGDGSYREQFKKIIKGHRIIGIFHGHYHSTGHYRWNGFDVYNVGSPKHQWRSFAIVNVTDERLLVASYNYEAGQWWWWHQKPLNDSTKRTIRGIWKRKFYIHPSLPTLASKRR